MAMCTQPGLGCTRAAGVDLIRVRMSWNEVRSFGRLLWRRLLEHELEMAPSAI